MGTRVSRGQTTLLAVVCAVAVATIYAAQPVLVHMGADVGLPNADVGWIVTVGQLGYLVGLALLVPWGDVVDRRVLITAHLVLAGVGTALAAVATSSWLLCAGLALAGLFAVVVQTAVAYAVALATPGERGRTLGTVTSGVVVGILGARVVSGALAALWGWRSIYATLAALLVALACLTRGMLPSDPGCGRGTYPQALTSLGHLFRERLFLSRGLIAFFLFASFGTLWSGLALPLAAPPWRLSPAQIGLFGVVGLAGAWGATRAGRWADAGFAGATTAGALVLLAGSWLAIGQAPWSLAFVTVGVVALDFAVQAVHVSNQHLLAAAHPQRTSSVIGGYMIFYSLGSALGAAVTTRAFAVQGWTGSSLLGSGFAVCALVSWAATRRAARGPGRVSRAAPPCPPDGGSASPPGRRAAPRPGWRARG